DTSAPPTPPPAARAVGAGGAGAGGGGRSNNPGGRGTLCAIKGAEGYRSNDRGASWTHVSGSELRNSGGTYSWVFRNVRVDPTDENTVYTLALGVSVSHDGGKTWGRMGAPQAGAPAVAGVAPPVAGAPPVVGTTPLAGTGGGGGRGGPGGDNHAMWID